MRTSISDGAAVTFAAALYRELAKGHTVETAVVEARRTLSLGEHRAEWATPALYLRGEDVRIFDPVPGEGARARRATGFHRFVASTLAAAVLGLLGLLGVWFWPTGGIPCPPRPPGLHDLEFVKIKAGVLELDAKTLTVEKTYCIATKEVSRRDWFAVMGALRHHPDWAGDLPMTEVTPADAEDFLEKLRLRDPGMVYRLPTADEWEYAARADRTTKYFFDDDPAELHRFGNCKNFRNSDGEEGPAPVGSYKPNPWGLYDVHGNVAEWVQWPEDLGSAIDAEGDELAIRLGGSFKNTPENCGFSRKPEPVKASMEYRPGTGFRVVRELDSPRHD